MTPADLQHLRALCDEARGPAIVTLFPVRVLRDLLAVYDAQQAGERAADGMAGRGA